MSAIRQEKQIQETASHPGLIPPGLATLLLRLHHRPESQWLFCSLSAAPSALAPSWLEAMIPSIAEAESGRGCPWRWARIWKGVRGRDQGQDFRLMNEWHQRPFRQGAWLGCTQADLEVREDVSIAPDRACELHIGRETERRMPLWLGGDCAPRHA